MLKNQILLLVAIVYSIALMAICLVNLGSVAHVGPTYSDKIFHFLAYCLMTLFWYMAFYHGKKWGFKKALVRSGILSIAFGVFIEFLQGAFTATREFDVFDIIANSTGVILTLLILMVKEKTTYKKI